MSKSNKPQDASASVTNLMDSLQQAGFKAMPGFSTDLMETMADMGSEMLNFTAARVQRDVQTQHDLLHAKGLAEIQHIQAQFFQKAMDDYAAETAKLLDLGKKLTPKIAADAGASE